MRVDTVALRVRTLELLLEGLDLQGSKVSFTHLHDLRTQLAAERDLQPGDPELVRVTSQVRRIVRDAIRPGAYR